MNLARFPRVRFAHLPTPLEHMPRLSAELGGPEIWIKRDDCTGMSTGGNKTRKLEWLMAEAKDQGADIVLTQGATQSNHARQTAAFAARMTPAPSMCSIGSGTASITVLNWLSVIVVPGDASRRTGLAQFAHPDNALRHAEIVSSTIFHCGRNAFC